jgi:Stage II sporulation protein E (SpoIIE)/PAS fold
VWDRRGVPDDGAHRDASGVPPGAAVGRAEAGWETLQTIAERGPAGGAATSADDIDELFDSARYRYPRGIVAPVAGVAAEPDWVANLQAVLDMLPGSVSVTAPIRNAEGEIVDFRVLAASPEAVDIAGRRGRDLVGLSTIETYPTIRDSEVWQAYLQVLETGRSREIGPFTYGEVAEGVAADAVYTIRAHRLGGCLLVNWFRHDDQRRFAARLEQYERLGNLGWVEWDHAGDTGVWSDQLFEIFQRDRSAGPATLEDVGRYVHADDRALVGAGIEALLRDGRQLDLEFRIQVPAGTRHLRAILKASLDPTGRPLRVFGIVQDVTAADEVRRHRARLAEVERELRERRRDLRTEHRMVRALQQIILPLPGGPVSAPRLTVAVRFQPAEELARVGGDWYDLVPLPSGSTLLIIGDVAGHGITSAATMVRLRHALAAFAITTTQPNELLALLNQMVCDDVAEPTATAVVARYDPDTATLVWAQAGHPPPLLVSTTAARALPRPRGMILGARRDAGYEVATVRLTEADTALLYTDGLVERRGPYEADWLGAVLREVAPLAGRSVEALVNGLHPGNTGDDTCLVALRPAAS